MSDFETLPTGTAAELTRLRKLVKMGEAVVEDFLPNVGKCVLQDYGRLNEFLIQAAQIKVDDIGHGGE